VERRRSRDNASRAREHVPAARKRLTMHRAGKTRLRIGFPRFAQKTGFGERR
jgi:hypothetical protein